MPLHASRDYSAVDGIDYHEIPLTYPQFLRQYLEPNLPVLLGPALTQHWKARQQWVCAETGKPNFNILRQHLCPTTTSVQVPVADCQCRDFTDQRRSTMDLRAFLDEWEANSLANAPSRTYLKDLHFVQTFPEYGAYETPDIFRDDWMNEFWTRRSDMDDDYRFVYCGGDGTFTPFHADVYRSYSWSANICGTKIWTLFPPDQEHLFRDSLNNTVYDIHNVDPIQFPHFHRAKQFTVLQQPGQTLFVPSGWWHQVQNVGDTISINHNWCNGSNLDLLLDSICADLKDVEREIDHLKDMMEESEWIETCQKLLLLNSGWDWSTVWLMCTTIRSRVRRQQQQHETTSLPQADGPINGSDNSTQDHPIEAEAESFSTFIQDDKVVPRRTPIFDPPLVSQQPPLDLTISRVDAVLDFIRNDTSARWFLENVKGISLRVEGING
ncbi:JmjC domain-containing protein 4 [Dissophora globulifera]|uniref:JmjC domain-containing protein 4 n=1 Tax=Dissophora globulifera TaxID=979702 RepID=A0A9P6RHT7_9FUNG|nr:JmjC domain-containing protein 4 [Dissophora globulifera]